MKTVESSYKTLKLFRVQNRLIPFHRLKLLPWKVSAEVKFDWKLSHHTLLKAFSKREMHKKLWLTSFWRCTSPSFLSVHSILPRNRKVFFGYQQKNKATPVPFQKKQNLAQKLTTSFLKSRKKPKKQPKQNTKQNKTKRTNLHNFDAYNLKLYFSLRDELLHRWSFPSSL